MKGMRFGKVLRLFAGLALAITAVVTVGIAVFDDSSPTVQLAEFDTSH